ncbi:MAG TPA: NAD(P)/FAD-dependent oxidoreductase [Chitinophagales bacterium]|nr:NAD(P)/FAD-dependent oxidoreductase [Chitinophagales bacterium]
MMQVSIIGSGLVGSLWAIFLAQRGYNVHVYEKRPDLRKHDIGGGRSINLALSDRGLKALHAVGLEDEIRRMTIPMHGRMIHHLDGKTELQPYGVKGQYINSISRSGLNQLLMTKAEAAGAVIEFETPCLGYDIRKKEAILENGFTKSDLLFGTDGAFSLVRGSLEKTDRFNYSQSYLEHGYKELHIPPDADGKFRMFRNALHIWPRKSFMLIALPNLDGSFTVTLFLAFEGEYSFAQLTSEQAVMNFFNRHFPDAVPLMPTLTDDFFTHPTGSLVTIRCYPWSYDNKVLLLGDAAHGIVPFYGQGMNAGFEDCTILSRLMEEFNHDWNKIIPAFQKSRKPDADAIAELALRNFIEMRDLVADKKFLLRKKIETLLHERHPDKYLPLYSMVTFSDMPYSKALELGKKHDAFFETIQDLDGLEKILGTKEGEKLLDAWAAKLTA